MKHLYRFFAMAYLMLFTSLVLADGHPADVQMRANINAVSKVMNNTDLSSEQKIAQLEQYADQYLDYQRIAALSIGMPWRDFSTTQKQDFITAFKEMIITMYAKSAIVAGEGAKVKILKQTQGKTKANVFTEITTKSNKKYQVEYQMYKIGQVYKVYNIKFEGNSLVTVYRNQFNDVIREKGIDGLITDLRNKSINKVEKISA